MNKCTQLQKAKELLDRLIDDISSVAPRTLGVEKWLALANACSDALSHVTDEDLLRYKEQIEYLRPEVLWFACEMEKKLRENDYKGGWRECDYSYLFERIWHEFKELLTAFDRTDTGETVPTKSAEVICEEAADIANLAMMIADNARLIAERLRGEK